MKAINRITEQAKTVRPALCESENPRVLYAACCAQQQAVSVITLVGNSQQIKQIGMNKCINLNEMEIISLSHIHYHHEFATALF